MNKDPWKAAGGPSSWQNHLGTDVPSCCCLGASYLVLLNIQIGWMEGSALNPLPRALRVFLNMPVPE